MGLSAQHRDWLRLLMTPGVGTAHFIRLLARFHSPSAILKAPVNALAEVSGRNLAQRIVQYRDSVDIDGQEQLMARHGAWLVTLEDPGYPLRLAEIHDPPLVLFGRGTLTEQDSRCVAIVGTRRASPYGVRMAERFGRDLAAKGFTVVSGLANGIDAAAHRGAIEAGGRTIGVLGNGVDVVYPPQNAELFDAVIQSGCIVSQFPMSTRPDRGHFPYRNRIISGLTLGTLIVEAPSRSGALITARQAAEQGREVFAVPGQVGSQNSQGPHGLIKEGAKLVENADDIVVELDLVIEDAPVSLSDTLPPEAEPARDEPAKPRARQEPVAPSPRREQSPAPAAQGGGAPVQTAPPSKPDSPEERKVLKALAADGSHVDEIAEVCRIPVSQALSMLTLLELKGLVRQFSGKRFAPR